MGSLVFQAGNTTSKLEEYSYSLPSWKPNLQAGGAGNFEWLQAGALKRKLRIYFFFPTPLPTPGLWLGWAGTGNREDISTHCCDIEDERSLKVNIVENLRYFFLRLNSDFFVYNRRMDTFEYRHPQ